MMGSWAQQRLALHVVEFINGIPPRIGQAVALYPLLKPGEWFGVPLTDVHVANPEIALAFPASVHPLAHLLQASSVERTAVWEAVTRQANGLWYLAHAGNRATEIAGGDAWLHRPF
jgi:hypothetical protein